jgi:hypothetical protein
VALSQNIETLTERKHMACHQADKGKISAALNFDARCKGKTTIIAFIILPKFQRTHCVSYDKSKLGFYAYSRRRFAAQSASGY